MVINFKFIYYIWQNYFRSCRCENVVKTIIAFMIPEERKKYYDNKISLKVQAAKN